MEDANIKANRISAPLTAMEMNSSKARGRPTVDGRSCDILAMAIAKISGTGIDADLALLSPDDVRGVAAFMSRRSAQMEASGGD